MTIAIAAGSTFEYGLKKMVLPAEGGYSNDAHDPGGRTMKGITEATARRHGINDVRSLSDSTITSIYHSDYWIPSRSGNFSNNALAIAHFDTTVNMGVGGGKKVLVNALNLAGMHADKSMSLDTLVGMANSCPDQKGLERAYLQARIERYNSIINHNSSLGCFRKGWMNRVEMLASLMKTDLTGLIASGGSYSSSSDSTSFHGSPASGGSSLSGIFGSFISMFQQFNNEQPLAQPGQEHKAEDNDPTKSKEDEEYVRVQGKNGLEHQIPVDYETEHAQIPDSVSKDKKIQQDMGHPNVREKIPTMSDILKELGEAAGSQNNKKVSDKKKDDKKEDK